MPDEGHPMFAAVYDHVMKPAEATAFRKHREYLVANLRGAVLDLGAGTGAMFSALKSATDREPPLALHATEPDPHMRRRAERRANELDLPVEMRPDMAEALAYPDDSFDVVLASLVLCTIADVEAALDEVARVLKPGGELRIFEHVHADGWLARLQDAVTPVWRRVAAGCHLNRDTAARLATDDRFEVAEREELDVGLPPATPFVRGRFVRRDAGGDPWRRLVDRLPDALAGLVTTNSPSARTTRTG